MDLNTFWAHSAQSSDGVQDSREGWQPLSEHLENVAKLSALLAGLAKPNDERFSKLAWLAGALHDYGKYGPDFQKMLATGKGRAQHSIHGAQVSFFGTAATEAEMPMLRHLAWAIAGHHSGLADLQGGSGSLMQRLKDADRRREAEKLLEVAKADAPFLRHAIEQVLPSLRATQHSPENVQFDIYTRMLFSCLVDADRLDSAGSNAFQVPLDAELRLDVLLNHLAGLGGHSQDGHVVKSMRQLALRNCLDAAESPSHLFSLSVPTGGGKTLAAMAFALKRAKLFPNSFRRIIVVIPFLSIIEQNAKIYSDLFGADVVLEHHSGSHIPLKAADAGEDGKFIPDEGRDDEGEEGQEFQTTGQRNATENWDAPIVVTTSVRFFESLFSNRPRDLRRVHNIARSIVVLDEVQTLPRKLIGPLLGMMKELAEHWGVNFVFSTATLPAFERAAGSAPKKQDLLWPPGTLTEIIQNPEQMRTQLKRAHIRWETQEPVGWDQVVERMLSVDQALAIVNLRDHAGELYQCLTRKAEERGVDRSGVFHLSSRMCAAHRLRVLSAIRERLRLKEPCWVVSTQLIEAGVDVDFPLVLRALAPLDSIIQAAGRADRGGKLTAALGAPAGEVVVFLPEDHRMPPNEYAEAAGITSQLVGQAIEDGETVQVDSSHMRSFFDRYYNVSLDSLGSHLDRHRHPVNSFPFDLKFATLAKEFEMISNRTRDVFVPDDEVGKAAIDELRRGYCLTSDLRRRLQRHTVSLNPSEFEKARFLLSEVVSGSELWIACDGSYDDQVGLLFELPAEVLIAESARG